MIAYIDWFVKRIEGIMVRLLQTIAGLRAYLEQESQGKTVGLVPTMGALHQGHGRLMEAARAENELVVVSIFVNPLQFGPQEDLDRYPQNLAADCEVCDRLGVDVVFAPSAAEMGITANPLDEPTLINPPATMVAGLCGNQRPGHFQGVATIVVQLLNLVQPDRAYFGRKDAQQLAIIRRLVADLKISVEIRPCAIVREPSGLAYSSRNQYLTPQQREQAAQLWQSLQQAHSAFERGQTQVRPLVEQVRRQLAAIPDAVVDYVELVDPEQLTPLEEVKTAGLLAIAVRFGFTRLIDNITLRQRRPIIAIDGPAGVGKSTVAQRLAKNLNLLYLDTGAMYRAMTWQVLELGIDVEDGVAIAELASRAEIQFIPEQPVQRVLINGMEVTTAIRTPEVTRAVSAVSSHRAVRAQLVWQQQQWGQQGGIVAEGRDIGTYVFPDAEVKIFLTASVIERARRRWAELQQQGYGHLTVEEVAAQLTERDRLDSTRQTAPLRQAEDAIALCTDGLTIPDVITRITEHYQAIAQPSPAFQII
nr:bifunctional pantoate--beta-alanine ligase/(d)CMP kinase [Spirulina sp. CCNP1310]